MSFQPSIYDLFSHFGNPIIHTQSGQLFHNTPTEHNPSQNNDWLKKLSKKKYCDYVIERGEEMRLGEEDHCCICLQHYSPTDYIYQLPCSHVLHVHCFTRNAAQSPNCPICRDNVSVRVRNQPTSIVPMINISDGEFIRPNTFGNFKIVKHFPKLDTLITQVFDSFSKESKNWNEKQMFDRIFI